MRIPIVDDNDEIICYKERADIQTGDIYRVSALWIRNSKGQVLLAKRALTKRNDPGKWGPAVAGTVEEGESYEENIIKEMQEELGLTGITPVPWKKHRRRGKHNFFGQWFIAVVDKELHEFTFPKDEVAELQWIDAEELKNDLKAHPEKYLPSAESWMEFI